VGSPRRAAQAEASEKRDILSTFRKENNQQVHPGKHQGHGFFGCGWRACTGKVEGFGFPMS
jgi:hypothetical protein